MILKRIATHFRQQDWFTVVVELPVSAASADVDVRDAVFIDRAAIFQRARRSQLLR